MMRRAGTRLAANWGETIFIQGDPVRRDRAFLASIPFARHEYASIVQTDYPGAHDAEYRQRVATLVDASREAWPHLPRYEYTEAENETWAFVTSILQTLQGRYSCQAYLDGLEALGLPDDHLPQLDDVSKTLEETTGFMLAPVGGLLDKREFLPMLQHRVMRCTPYVRHPSYPFFTPEPDILHELRGHAPMFMHEPFVEFSVGVGRASRAAVDAGDDEMIELIGLFYWYTVEYGLIREGGEVRIFGAGNNAGIQDMLRAIDPTVPKKRLTIEAIEQLTIDYDAPQEVFFVADSWDHIIDLSLQLNDMALRRASRVAAGA